jgi:putative tryptophan/tyrosine transport system substrate-binding protein
MLDSKRREFIALLGGGGLLLAAKVKRARGQQPAMPVIGFVNSQSPDGYADRLRAFRQGLKEAGYVEGENVAIEYRWAEAQLDRLPALAAELVRRQVAVIAALGNANVALAAKAATTSTPIVFLVGEDPVRLGLVASLARPGGNMTGINLFADEIAAKRLSLLREIVPTASRVAALINPINPSNADIAARDLEAAAHAMGLRLHVRKASNSREIDEAFATFAGERPDALFVAGDTLFNSRRVQLVHLASHYRLPTVYASRAYPEIGGLMSYGTNVSDAYRLAGVYTGRTLKGAKPAELPVLQPTKFELIINLQIARMLGLEVPPTLLARADEVIE